MMRVFLDISHKSKEFIIEKLPSIYRQFLETQMLDISKSPMEVAPTAHYSMGGILVNPENLSTSVEGLLLLERLQEDFMVLIVWVEFFGRNNYFW